MVKLLVIGVLLCGFGCGDVVTTRSGDSGSEDVRDAGSPCDMHSTLANLAGVGAIDCGYVRFGEDSQAADACAVSAFTASRPFFVSYDRRGTDSHLVRGIVQESSGHLWFVDYDGNVGGGGGDTNAAIDEQTCDGPTVSTTPGDRTLGEMPIACASTEPYARVCP